MQQTYFQVQVFACDSCSDWLYVQMFSLVLQQPEFLCPLIPSLSWGGNTEPHIYSLVVTSCHLKLAKEYVCIAKIAVSPPLCRLISKLFCNKKTLHNKKKNSRMKIIVSESTINPTFSDKDNYGHSVKIKIWKWKLPICPG